MLNIHYKIMSRIGKYLRTRKHIDYVEKQVLELRAKICKQAIECGCADVFDRKMFLKYNAYLKELNE